MRRSLVLLGLIGILGCTKDDPTFCMTDGDCKDPSRPVCDTAGTAYPGAPTNTCVGQMQVPDGGMALCHMSSQCMAANEPICDTATSRCRGCTSTTECGTKKCDLTSGACVECLTQSDCTGGLACVQQTCKTCMVNSDCDSRICESGQCIAMTNIVYVDALHCSSSGTGAQDSPYCTLAFGVVEALSSGKKYVHVSSGIYTDPSMQIGAGQLTLIGDGEPRPSIRTNDSDKAILEVTGTADLKLVGLVIENSGGTNLSDGDGLLCNGSSVSMPAKLTVLSSNIQGNKAQGIDATNCFLTVDATYVTGNHGGGIKVDSTDFQITNLFLADNGTSGVSGSSFGGFYLVSSTGGMNLKKFENNTVASNFALTGNPAAMSCGIPMLSVNAIVWGHTPPDTAFSSQCTFDHSDVQLTTGAVGGTGNVNMDPLFVGSGDYHLTSGSTACIDKGTSDGAPTHDIDGDPRPRSTTGGYDIGADQFMQ